LEEKAMKEEKRKCRVCGCTDGDCRQCVEKTGNPCFWVEDDLCSACKTTVVSFMSIKGGTGKSTIVINLAKCLAAAGKRVLAADSDLNNSLCSHFINDDDMERTKSINLAAALSDEANNLCDYVVPTITPGVDIIASTPYLADLRTLNEKRLKRMISTLYGKYDILIIDCPPTYDNIVLNAVNASDYTITPVLKDLFSYNAAAFLAGVLPRDVENFKNWFVLINGYDKRFEEAKTGRQNDFLELYRKGGFPLTPVETWLPWTAQIHLLVDYRKSLTCAKGNSGAVYNPDLYKAITELAGCFFDDKLVIPEVF
jgi:chromosome partitioning protein